MEKSKEQWLEEGDNYCKAEQYKESIEAYSKAIELDPDDAETYRLQGNAQEGLDRYGRAIADYDKAIELEPYSCRFYINRGDAYCKVKKYEEAIADYNEAIELADDDSDLIPIYEKRGDVYILLEDYDKAKDDYQEAFDRSRSRYSYVSPDLMNKLRGINVYKFFRE